jgi:hypothetical protein
MVDDVLYPGEVGVASGRRAILPALVLAQTFATPIAHVKGRIGEDEIRFEIGEAIVVECVAVGDLAFDAPDGRYTSTR